MGHITFDNFTVTVCNFFAVAIYYVDVVLYDLMISESLYIIVCNILIPFSYLRSKEFFVLQM